VTCPRSGTAGRHREAQEAKVQAEREAKAKAEAEELEKRRKSSHTWVTVYGPNGDTSIRYDGLGKPTDSIDSAYGTNRSETTYHDLENKQP
jgi:hypothetical protein